MIPSAASAGDTRPWAVYPHAGVAGIGPDAVSSCRRSVCRLCDAMMLHNAVDVVHPSVVAYIQQHVVVGVITGSQDNFHRVDLALCTWLGHVPAANLFVFTDSANASDGRHGAWLESDITTQLQVVSKKILAGTMYSAGWRRAQYRFLHSFKYFAELANKRSDLRWAVVVDDDTFLDLHALVRFLHRRDLDNLARAAKRLERTDSTWSLSWESRCRQKADVTTKKVFACNFLLETWSQFLLHNEGQGQSRFLRHLTNSNTGALAVGSVLWNATTGDLLLGNEQALELDPLYIGDRGWGGAGHYMNTAALRLFAEGGEKECVQKQLVRKGLASDTALKKCLPALRIGYSTDGVLSHCQARYLKERLLKGEMVSAHVKRDLVIPKHLAMWRMRLYYQVLYHRNYTAYKVLMRVGSCAYGYSCKRLDCTPREDALAMREYLLRSGNNTYVPLC